MIRQASQMKHVNKDSVHQELVHESDEDNESICSFDENEITNLQNQSQQTPVANTTSDREPSKTSPSMRDSNKQKKKSLNEQGEDDDDDSNSNLSVHEVARLNHYSFDDDEDGEKASEISTILGQFY